MKEVDSRSWNSSGAEEEEKRGSVEAGGYLRAVQSISPKFVNILAVFAGSVARSHTPLNAVLQRSTNPRLR